MGFKCAMRAILILLLVSSPALAKNARPFSLRTAVTMNGVEVPAGEYQLSYESRNSVVRITLWKDGQFFATAQGNWVKNGAKFAGDAALLRVNSDGSRSLVEIRIAGEKKSIVLQDSMESTVQAGAKQVGAK